MFKHHQPWSRGKSEREENEDDRRKHDDVEKGENIAERNPSSSVLHGRLICCSDSIKSEKSAEGRSLTASGSVSSDWQGNRRHVARQNQARSSRETMREKQSNRAQANHKTRWRVENGREWKLQRSYFLLCSAFLLFFSLWSSSLLLSSFCFLCSSLLWLLVSLFPCLLFSPFCFQITNEWKKEEKQGESLHQRSKQHKENVREQGQQREKPRKGEKEGMDNRDLRRKKWTKGSKRGSEVKQRARGRSREGEGRKGEIRGRQYLHPNSKNTKREQNREHRRRWRREERK